MARSNHLSTSPKVEIIHSGIGDDDAREMANALSQALADSFTLYLKTLGVHWNVVGPSFYGLHNLTEDQYKDLQEAIDQIAERIRAIGHPAPAGFEDYRKLSPINVEKTLKTTEEMLQALCKDNETIAKRYREFVKVADKASDVFTADLLTARIGVHEQNAWMLRSLAST